MAHALEFEWNPRSCLRKDDEPDALVFDRHFSALMKGTFGQHRCSEIDLDQRDFKAATFLSSSKSFLDVLARLTNARNFA